MQFNRRATISLAAALMLAAPFAAQAKPLKFSGTFVAEHGATSTPEGEVTGSLNMKTGIVKYKITYSGLTGPVVAAHFHGPATDGVDAGVMLPIPGPYKSGMHGKITADAATEKAMLAGQTYVNLHTAQYPNGEARAQITFSS